MTQVTPDSKYLVVGAIVGVCGIKGWVRIRSWTRPAGNIFGYRPWLLSRSKGADVVVAATKPGDLDGVELQEHQINGDRLVAKLANADDRNQAELLVGRQILVAQSMLPRLDDDEYYWSDLIGLRVRDKNGADYGKVEQMLETGANDVLVVRGDRERLIPYVVEQYVLQVNLDQGYILVNWDETF